MKYRQPGYHDKDYQEERQKREKRGPRGPREITTREATAVVRCFNCGHQTSPAEVIAFESACEKCGEQLHICRNCLHFDTSARWECRKPIAAPIRSKTARNECDLFSPQAVLDATGRRAPSEPAGPAISAGRAAFDALFKKK